MEPIEFIVSGPGSRELRVSEEAIDLFRRINKPLKIVSIVGNYRTGKSFLLNRLMKRNDGFPLGSTVESKTKGIWMWVGDHPDDPTKSLVLLDTEGLNDVKKGDRSHDAQIFTLAILLSSILVYNSTGAIGAEALEGLHVASELSKHIQTRQCSEVEFATFFPAFIWAIRDFHLRLQDSSGRMMSANQYLEMSLAVQPGATGNRDFTAVKQAIRDHFPRRDCFTFLPPVPFKQLENLETMQEADLDPDFLEAGEMFTNFVYQNNSLFQLKGEVLTGNSFAVLAEQYVSLINRGSINLQSAHDYMINSINSEAIEAAMKQFAEFLAKLQFPMSSDDFFNACKDQRELLFNEFRTKSINLGDHPNYLRDFDDQYGSLVEKYRQQNLDTSLALCQNKLSGLYEPIHVKLEANGYHKPGGFYELKKDVDLMEQQYKDLEGQMEMGPGFADTRLDFWETKVAILLLANH